MSGAGDEDENKVGKGKPPKEHQFPPGTSGNRRGRPPKRKSILVPDEIRRTVLRLLDEEVEMTTPAGVRKVTLFDAIFRRTLAGAAKGNPTQLRLAMKLIIDSLYGRLDTHKAVWLTNLLQDIEESSQDEPDPDRRRLIKGQLKYIKNMY